MVRTINQIECSKEKIHLLFFASLVILISLLLRTEIFFQDAVDEKKGMLLVSKDGALFLMDTTEPFAEEGDTTSILPEHAPLLFEKININTASYELLLSVPGIGPKTAEKILNLRSRKGSFQRANELLEIKGIGPKKLEKFNKYLFFSDS